MATAAQQFTASEWLDRFEESGGWWIITDGKLRVGWPAGHAPAAAAHWRQLVAVPSHHQAVRDLLVARAEA